MHKRDCPVQACTLTVVSIMQNLVLGLPSPPPVTDGGGVGGCLYARARDIASTIPRQPVLLVTVTLMQKQKNPYIYIYIYILYM